VSDERDPNAPKLLYRGQAERALARLREPLEDCTTLHTFSAHDPIHGWYQLGNWFVIVAGQEGVFRIRTTS
jgi:adenine-specific DNA methylase